MLEEEADEVTSRIVEGLGWEGEVFKISAFNKTGTAELSNQVMTFIDSLPAELEEASLEEKSVEFKWDTYHDEAMSEVDDDLDDEDWDEDDYDVEVEYRQ